MKKVQYRQLNMPVNHNVKRSLLYLFVIAGGWGLVTMQKFCYYGQCTSLDGCGLERVGLDESGASRSRATSIFSEGERDRKTEMSEKEEKALLEKHKLLLNRRGK